MNKYIEKLSNEWLQHKNIIIAVTFDGPIFPYGESIVDHKRVIKLLRKAHDNGAVILISTDSSPDRYDEISKHCDNIGLSISGINQNYITPFGDNRKIYANIFLDERAGIEEALSILEKSMYNFIGVNKLITQF